LLLALFLGLSTYKGAKLTEILTIDIGSGCGSDSGSGNGNGNGSTTAMSPQKRTWWPTVDSLRASQLDSGGGKQTVDQLIHGHN